MSQSLRYMEVRDSLVDAASREISFEFRRAMETYNVQIDSRAEYAFGQRVRQILSVYDHAMTSVAIFLQSSPEETTQCS